MYVCVQVAVLSVCVTLPMVYNYVQHVRRQMHHEMTFCKVRRLFSLLCRMWTHFVVGIGKGHLVGGEPPQGCAHTWQQQPYKTSSWRRLQPARDQPHAEHAVQWCVISIHDKHYSHFMQAAASPDLLARLDQAASPASLASLVPLVCPVCLASHRSHHASR